ncbi:prepilin-type N-terminal cleavage/methylation domain-containing protein [Neobacillus sp. WH10]|uniref:prepilin-type N-terminal cleavage/methylation domain-containing protein n=1 Tax=Neobacillus sp. WH10 TaxID=3047873 RepID=UPI0024C1CF89|nr:prepilin-type N-terminal cleavage/methylation domain-containing protein [Neobacillus sp. WH10]WHY76351.1 prepilin-type N-terminal cleavage/methylation domain-containing protein [Neobacillus sp. WH10]
MVESLRLKVKEQKGFTLIELLAVIVILGIIAAIAIPAISNVITKSDNKAKVQDALLIIDAAKLYVADNRPTAATTSLTKDGANSTTSLANYLDRVKDDGFTVTVDYTASTGVYTYKIKDHEGCKVVSKATSPAKSDEVSEKALIDFVNP